MFLIEVKLKRVLIGSIVRMRKWIFNSKRVAVHDDYIRNNSNFNDSSLHRCVNPNNEFHTVYLLFEKVFNY